MTRKLAIDIQNLTKYYRGNAFPAIDRVTLGIPEGHIFGLLGPNGAGKTTMIRILCGLLTPSEGEITIGGYSLKSEMARIRRIIGVVPRKLLCTKVLRRTRTFQYMAEYTGSAVNS